MRFLSASVAAGTPCAELLSARFSGSRFFFADLVMSTEVYCNHFCFSAHSIYWDLFYSTWEYPRLHFSRKNFPKIFIFRGLSSSNASILFPRDYGIPKKLCNSGNFAQKFSYFVIESSNYKKLTA